MLIKNEKQLLFQLLNEQEKNDSFRQECVNQEVEWNITKCLKMWQKKAD